MVNSIYGETQPPKPAILGQGVQLKLFLEKVASPKVLRHSYTLMEIMNSLTDEQFTKAYILAMKEYDYWRPGMTPNCRNCGSEILKPQDLRKYHGMSLDSNCFKTVWNKERDKVKDVTTKEYFDRVLKLEKLISS